MVAVPKQWCAGGTVRSVLAPVVGDHMPVPIVAAIELHVLIVVVAFSSSTTTTATILCPFPFPGPNFCCLPANKLAEEDVHCTGSRLGGCVYAAIVDIVHEMPRRVLCKTRGGGVQVWPNIQHYVMKRYVG
jgi:hypothetical protein